MTSLPDATARDAITAAKRRVPLTEDQFRAELSNGGVIKRLTELDRWTENTDDPGRFSFGDLWRFYQEYARSDFDLRAADLARSHAGTPKGLRSAARTLRRALKLLGVAPLLSSSEAEILRNALESLRRVEEILVVSLETRTALIAEGVPPDRIMGFADQVESLVASRGRRRGKRPDEVNRRFFKQWPNFAEARAGEYLAEIGEMLYPIVVGRPAPADFERSMRRFRD